jgi:hypothetical protein
VSSWHLQGCSPRLCRLSTDRLAPRVSIERTDRMLVFMGLVSLVVDCRQKLNLPTVSLAVVGEKLGTDPRIGQSACYGLCREPFFSGVVDLFKSVDDSAKGCYMWTI